MNKIVRLYFDEPDRQAVQDAVTSAVERDPERFIRAYLADPRSHGGRYIGADLFKETFEEFRASREARNRYNAPVHNRAAVLSAELFDRRLALDDPATRIALFVTGIPGAGKTTSILESDASFPKGTRLIFEGQLVRPETTLDQIGRALDAGLLPRIVAVHVRPETALENTLKRFEHHGRGASINLMAQIQGNLPIGLQKVREAFGDRVSLRIQDNRERTNARTLVGWDHLETLRSEGGRDAIRQRLADALERRRPTLPDAAWRQAAGQPPRALDGRMDGEDVRTGQAHGRGTGVRGTGEQEVVLAFPAAAADPASARTVDRLREAARSMPAADQQEVTTMLRALQAGDKDEVARALARSAAVRNMLDGLMKEERSRASPGSQRTDRTPGEDRSR